MSYKGGYRSEFGIIDNFDYEKDYGKTYQPKKYGCIAVCAEALDDSGLFFKDIEGMFTVCSQIRWKIAS
jgi:hypothetical protein